jgi:MFS transporter, ACS family, D-galactonate transporter
VRVLTDGGMDSVSARRAVIFGGLLIGTAALLVTVNVSNLYASVTAMSLGYASVMSILGPMWSTPAEIAGPKGVGFASGFVNFIGNVGGIGSPILMGVVFQHFHSFTPAILISAGITMICGVLFILLYRAKADKEFVAAFLAS